MNLSKTMEKKFIEEIRFVLKNMKSVQEPAKKLYFFSATYAMAQRILNLEYDPELNFIMQVLQHAHATIDGRVSAVLSGRETAISIPENLFDRLEDALQEMVDCLERDQQTYLALQKIANLAYSTTGNGYYLHLKGALKV